MRRPMPARVTPPIDRSLYAQCDAEEAATIERKALLADIAGALSLMNHPPPVLPPPSRFRVRYGVVYCAMCGLATPYCKGHAPAAPPAQDGDASDLVRRIREAREQAGGR